MTVFSYFNNEPLDKQIHEKNIQLANKYCAKNKIYRGMNFDELLLKVSNIHPDNINSTSIELIVNNIIGYRHIFDSKNKLAVIFLKNEKFFVVICDKLKYYLRDCHKSTQYNFESLDDLKKKLNGSYQFNSKIDLIIGQHTNYSSIEFIKIYQQFTLNL